MLLTLLITFLFQDIAGEQDISSDVTAKGTLAVPFVPIRVNEDAAVDSKASSQDPKEGRREFSLYHGLKEHFDGFIMAQHHEQREVMVDGYQQYLVRSDYDRNSIKYGTDLFSRYADYKYALVEIDEDYQADVKQLISIERRLDALDDLRAQYFSQDEYFYLFKDDQEFDEAALERLRIAQDKTLNKAQKHNLVLQQIATLNESQRQGFSASVDVMKLQSLASNNVDENLQFNQVAAEFGTEVAERFQKRQQQQASWREKVADFQRQVQQISNDSRVNELQKQNLIEKLRKTAFSEKEQRRLTVFLENPMLLSGG